jgi:hypothetical protein
MGLRFPHKPIKLPPDHVLYQYWGAEGHFRPAINVFLRGPSGASRVELAYLDSGSPYILFDEWVARELGLALPLPRHITGQGVGGHEVGISFPEKDEVVLFLSDYRSGYYAWRPLVGFLSPPPEAGDKRPDKETRILGFTGFFQYFDVTYPTAPNGPEIDLVHKQNFPGRHGTWPLPRGFWDAFDRPG